MKEIFILKKKKSHWRNIHSKQNKFLKKFDENFLKLKGINRSPIFYQLQFIFNAMEKKNGGNGVLPPEKNRTY